MSERNRVFLRKADLVMISVILTLLGMLFVPLKKFAKMETAIDKIDNLDHRVVANDKAIAIVNTQYTEIKAQLREIKEIVRDNGRR